MTMLYRQLRHVFKQVERGATITITSYGKPVATINPWEDKEPPPTIDGVPRDEYLENLRRMMEGDD